MEAMAGISNSFPLLFWLAIAPTFSQSQQGIEVMLINQGFNSNEDEAVAFLRRYEERASSICTLLTEATWNYHTNITEYNKNIMLQRQMEGTAFRRRWWEEAVTFRWKSFQDPSIRRLFSFLSLLGSAALAEEERAQYSQLLQDMKTEYSRTRICPYDSFSSQTLLSRGVNEVTPSSFQYRDAIRYLNDNNACIPSLSLEPDLSSIMEESRNPEELRYIWTAWRNRAGRPARQKFLRFVELSNAAARLNGFSDTGEFWRSAYESDTLEEDLERLWSGVKPLYEQLHAYVRRKLMDTYGADSIPTDGTIPAHLLGNMWSQSWMGLVGFVLPYPNLSFTDPSQRMRQLGYTPIGIFRTAEDFFNSMGFESLSDVFYTKSMLQKPVDREVNCHASSWDFCNGRDYRIKQCTRITLNDLITSHHEMGHIYYAMAYRNMPLPFRDGANPGFHEAVGDAVALAALNPAHQRDLGLVASLPTSYEEDINFLFRIALDKVAFLPFGYLVDKWRWRIFSGEIPRHEMNTMWWELVIQYQGISPPVTQTEEDFDPGAKYHVIANIPYMRYFVGHILQFQILEELCRGHEGSLHTCDLYQSREAGDKLKKLMRLGKSQTWQQALSDMTNGRVQKLDAGPLLRYFSSLHSWLVSRNKDEEVGWSSSSAIASLRGYILNLSSSTFIALVIGLFIFLVLLGCVFVYFFRRAKERKVTEIQPDPGSKRTDPIVTPSRKSVLP